MRTIERSSIFGRDYKRVKATPRRGANVDSLLSSVLGPLISDAVLPASNLDHALSGDRAGYRERHVKPDLLLIYRRVGDDILRLAWLGSHRELFS